MLVLICRKWRRIVLLSQRALQLRLFCTHGTPVSKALDCWPALPIIVQYGGCPALSPPAPEDQGNIKTALKQSGRVSSINLTVTRSHLANFANEKPFSELEELVLLSRDNTQLTLPSAFRWGPRLRRLHSTGIAFPALLRRLSSSRDLVDIQLHDVSYHRNLSPKALANALSGMAQLQSLSLHFLSTTNRITMSSHSGNRVILPAITRFSFRGITKYLEDLLARIDAPRLGDIEITLLDEPTSDVSSLLKFIGRVEIQESYRRADILFTEHSVSITLTQPAPTCLKLQVPCEAVSRQLFHIARICNLFSAFLIYVDDLRIKATRLSRMQDGTGPWTELIGLFGGTKWFYVTGGFSTEIVLALQHTDGTMLPALYKLCIREPRPHHALLREAVVSLMVSRQCSGRLIGGGVRTTVD